MHASRENRGFFAFGAKKKMLKKKHPQRDSNPHTSALQARDFTTWLASIQCRYGIF